MAHPVEIEVLPAVAFLAAYILTDAVLFVDDAVAAVFFGAVSLGAVSLGAVSRGYVPYGAVL